AIAARARGPQPITEAIARDYDLADDLAGREIAYEPLRAGVTERAGERAADLAGDAKRAAVGLGNVDAFDLVWPLAQNPVRMFAGEPQQPFARAVDGDLLGHDLGAREREMLFERRAQLLRHAGHLIEAARPAHVEPVPDLLHAHFALWRGHADGRKRFCQLRAREPHQRG